MSTMPSMPLYVGDFLHATMGLTAEQKWCYLAILGCMWEHRGGISGDPTFLAGVCDISKTRLLRKVWPAIKRYFTPAGEMIRQKRLEKELQKTGKKPSKVGSEAAPETNLYSPENPPPPHAGASLPLPEPSPISEEGKNVRPATQPDSETSRPLGAEVADLKFKRFGSGDSGSGKWSDPEQRDAFARQRIIEALTTTGGLSMAAAQMMAMAAEDPAADDHATAARAFRAAAKQAGVGWVSPERRKANGHAAAA